MMSWWMRRGRGRGEGDGRDEREGMLEESRRRERRGVGA